MPLPSWKKVLVVDLGFLGDTVHSIPATRALAQAGAQVDVLTTNVGQDLLGMVPEVNRAWVVPLRKPSPPPWRHWKTLRDIRAQKYDGAISFVGSDRNLFCTGWSGARDRIAHLTGRNSWVARCRLTQIISQRDRANPVYEQRLSVLQELGWLGSNPGWAWQIPLDDHSWATSQISASTIHFSISAASSPLNEWPLDFWAETLRQVWQKSPQTKFLSTGSGSEREIARQSDLVSLVQDERLQSFFNPMPMSRLAALLERATLHVGLDSGVLHLAMALGKPTVSLFRDSVGRPGWVPRGAKHRALIKKCPCNETGQNKCFESRPLCLSLIKPQEVAQAVLAALEQKL